MSKKMSTYAMTSCRHTMGGYMVSETWVSQPLEGWRSTLTSMKPSKMAMTICAQQETCGKSAVLLFA